MEVSFDPEKRAATLLERSLDFADAVTVFDGPVFEFEDDRFDYAEPRYSTIGMLDGRMVGGDLDRGRRRAACHFDEEGE